MPPGGGVLRVTWTLAPPRLEVRVFPSPAGCLALWQGGRAVAEAAPREDGGCTLDASGLDAARDAFLWHRPVTGEALFLDRLPARRAPRGGTGAGPGFRRRSLARIAMLRPGASPVVNGRPVPPGALEGEDTLLASGLPETLWLEAGDAPAEALLRTELRPVTALRALIAERRRVLLRPGDAPPALFTPLALQATETGMGLIGTWGDGAGPVVLDLSAIRDVAPRGPRPAGPRSPPGLGALRRSVAGEPPPSAPPAVTVLPSREGEAPPRFGGRCVLLRPGHAPTDDLYVTSGWTVLAARHGWDIAVADQSSAAAPEDPRFLRAGDLVAVTRTVTEPWFRRLAARRDRVRIAYVMDDDVTVAAATAALPPDYRARMDEVARVDLQAMLRLCHDLVVTSDHLARRFASPKTRLLHPPCLRFPANLSHHDSPGPFRVALHATDGHREDVAFLWPVLVDLAREFGEAVEIEVISGHAPEPPAPNLRVLRQMRWPDYVAHAAGRPAHAFVVPVLPTEWNAAKSVVKVHDAVALGAAGVFSDQEPYRGVVRDGVDGFLAADRRGWGDLLRRLVRERGSVRRVAVRAGERARREFGAEGVARFWAGLLGVGSGPERP